MRLSTKAILAGLMAPSLWAATAHGAVRFEEFLINPSGADEGFEFIELFADSASDLVAGTALIAINGNGDAAGTIDAVFDLELPAGLFPANNLILLQDADASINPLTPPPAADTLVADGLGFFPVQNGSSTLAVVSGITGSPGDLVGFDLDTSNDGTIDATLPWTGAFDAVSLLNSQTSSLLIDPVTFTGRAYADDLGGVVFDQAFDVIGISDDGADGFFRFTDGTPAAFDTNGQPDLGPTEFDNGTTPLNPDGFEEIVIINGAGQTQLANVPTDRDPGTEGDQPFTLTPGSPNDIPLPGTLGAIIPTPDPPEPLDPDFYRFGENLAEPAGQFIAGTSFENETATGFYEVTEGTTVVEGQDGLPDDLNANGITGETVVLPASLDGDSNPDETFTIRNYADPRTLSEPDSGETTPGPLGDEGVSSGETVVLANDTQGRIRFDGPDNQFGTADDVFFESLPSVVNSTSSSAAAGDLGFSTVFIDTREDNNETGLADGDPIGVYDYDFLGEDRVPDDESDPTTLGPQDGRDGSNYFLVNDTDGTLVVTFDTVDLSDFRDVQLSMLLGVENTGFEGDDSLLLELIVDTAASTGESLVLFDIGEATLDIFGDTSDAGDGFGQLIFDIPDEVLSATLQITGSTSSGSEEFAIDDIGFFGTLIDALGLAGDYNDNGQVEQGDLDLVLGSWGQTRPFDPNGDPFASPIVDQEELDRVLSNWGNSSVAPSFANGSVPEPAAAALLAGLGVLGLRRRR